MKEQVNQTNAEYIMAMMKRFKLVDMREQYQDLILEAEVTSMDYETFLVRLLSIEEKGKQSTAAAPLSCRKSMNSAAYPPTHFMSFPVLRNRSLDAPTKIAADISAAAKKIGIAEASTAFPSFYLPVMQVAIEMA